MTPTPEFSRPHRLDRIGTGDSDVRVEASPEERAALAKRFRLVSIDVLAADFTLRRDAAGVVARGTLKGAVVQSCVATAEPVPATIDESFALRFLPEGTPEGDEIELSSEECDTMFFEGGAIDLGEAAAETLALAELVRSPLPVPAIAIWSRSDGLVNGLACRSDDCRAIEIRSSHLGVQLRPDVLRAIASILTEGADQ